MSNHRRKSKGSHHLDSHADQLIVTGEGNENDMLSTEEVASWLHTSVQWLEKGRWKGWGPPYKRITPKMIRYRRSDVLAWLETRTHSSTAEYYTR